MLVVHKGTLCSASQHQPQEGDYSPHKIALREQEVTHQKQHHFLAMFICLHHKGIEITWYCMSTALLTIYVHKTDDATLCNPAWLISTIGISFGE